MSDYYLTGGARLCVHYYGSAHGYNYELYGLEVTLDQCRAVSEHTGQHWGVPVPATGPFFISSVRVTEAEAMEMLITGRNPLDVLLGHARNVRVRELTNEELMAR